MTYQTPAKRILGFILSIYIVFMVTGCEPVDDDSVGSTGGALSAEGLDIDATECVTVKFGDDSTCKPEKAWVFYADSMSADRGLEMVRYRLGQKCGAGGFVGIKFLACPVTGHCGVEDVDTDLEKPVLSVVPVHPIKEKPELDDDSDNEKPDWTVIAPVKTKPAADDDAPIKIKPVVDTILPIKVHTKPAADDDAPIKIKPVVDTVLPIKVHTKPETADDAPIKIKPVVDTILPIKVHTKPEMADDAPIKIKPVMATVLPIKMHTKPVLDTDEPVKEKPELDFDELDFDEDGDESNLGADIAVPVETSKYFVAIVSDLHHCTDGKELLRRARFVCKANHGRLINFGLYQGRCEGPTDFDSLKFTCAALK